MLDALDLSRGRWRGLLTGSDSSTVEQLVILAGLLGASCAGLVREPQSARV